MALVDRASDEIDAARTIELPHNSQRRQPSSLGQASCLRRVVTPMTCWIFLPPFTRVAPSLRWPDGDSSRGFGFLRVLRVCPRSLALVGSF